MIGIYGASKETGPHRSIVGKTIEHHPSQRNQPQDPQLAGDYEVAQTATTASATAWRTRRTISVERAPPDDAEAAQAALPATLPAEAGHSPSSTRSSSEIALKNAQYQVSRARSQRADADPVDDKPHFDAPANEVMARPPFAAGVEQSSLCGVAARPSLPFDLSTAMSWIPYNASCNTTSYWLTVDDTNQAGCTSMDYDQNLQFDLPLCFGAARDDYTERLGDDFDPVCSPPSPPPSPPRKEGKATAKADGVEKTITKEHTSSGNISGDRVRPKEAARSWK